MRIGRHCDKGMSHRFDCWHSYTEPIPWSRIVIGKCVKKFHTLHKSWREVTMLTKAWHWTLSLARWIQLTLSHPITLMSIYICHQGRDLPSGPFPSDFPTIRWIMIWQASTKICRSNIISVDVFSLVLTTFIGRKICSKQNKLAVLLRFMLIWNSSI